MAAFTAWLKDNHPAAVYLRDVTPDMAAGFFRHLGKERYSGNRINSSPNLENLFPRAGEAGPHNREPFAEIARREHIAHTKRPFTIEELKTIIEKANGEMKTLFMLGTFTGLRLADTATLRWNETDLARGIIRRIPRKTKRTGKAVIIGIPTILGEHLAGLERLGLFIMPETAAAYERDESAVCKKIQAHLEQCGIQTATPGAGKRAVVVAGFHSLRHSFVSLHAQAGTPQAVLMKLAGHGNPMMSEHYTHISEATARTAAAALPHILGDAQPVKALPAPLTVSADAVRELAEKLTGKTWRNVKTELEKLAGVGV